jgi:catechol 2,3-dioxygenase-like lactoylglutathione lyase family enzyme
MLDHVTISVADYGLAKSFYCSVLSTINISLLFEKSAEAGGMQAGFGAANKPFFWISHRTILGGPVHIAFGAKSREEVQSFYDAALNFKAQDNGPPGMRPQYHPLYYSAFVLDLDGNNIEAVYKAWEQR